MEEVSGLEMAFRVGVAAFVIVTPTLVFHKRTALPLSAYGGFAAVRTARGGFATSLVEPFYSSLTSFVRDEQTAVRIKERSEAEWQNSNIHYLYCRLRGLLSAASGRNRTSDSLRSRTRSLVREEGL
jgi:hypothetical protein